MEFSLDVGWFFQEELFSHGERPPGDEFFSGECGAFGFRAGQAPAQTIGEDGEVMVASENRGQAVGPQDIGIERPSDRGGLVKKCLHPLAPFMKKEIISGIFPAGAHRTAGAAVAGEPSLEKVVAGEFGQVVMIDEGRPPGLGSRKPP